MPEAAVIFIFLLAATFGIAWVGGMDYQRLHHSDKDEVDR